MEQIIAKTALQACDLRKKGSQLRCLLLSGMEKAKLQNSLIRIIDQKNPGSIKIEFTDDFEYFPKGLAYPTEIELDKAKIPVNGSTEYCKELRGWWLGKYARTPVWDFVCTASIDGAPGLILIEAKAHQNEFLKFEDSSKAKKGSANRIRIESALSEINAKYKYNMTANNYFQLSNRIAWCIKLASLGIPVVLVYLGCLGTEEMIISENDSLLRNAQQWEGLVTEYSKKISFSDWETQVSGELLQDSSSFIEPALFYPIIRTVDIQVTKGEITFNSI